MASAVDENEVNTNDHEDVKDDGEENDDTELGEACGSNKKKKRRRNRHKKGTAMSNQLISLPSFTFIYCFFVYLVFNSHNYVSFRW